MKLKPCPSCERGCKSCSQTGLARKQPAYLKFVRTRPCVSCGKNPPSEAHHEYLEHGEKAFGQRTHDLRALPLCRECHRERTDAAQDYFWGVCVKDLAGWMNSLHADFERWKGTP